MNVGAPNGQAGAVDNAVVEQIKQALQIVHNPQSPHDTRKQAEAFLENAKADTEAPYHGYLLASDGTQEPIVRHYALSMLEHKIKFGWVDYRPEDRSMIRQWCVTLAEKVDGSEPIYVRNKVGQLWVDVAKREWGEGWPDMDQMLVNLWVNGNAGQKELCLYILETLAGDVFAREDAIAGIRSTILTRACLTIFCPASQISSEDQEVIARCGTEGWLSRLTIFLGECLTAGAQDAAAVNGALKILAALKASVNWVTPSSIALTHVVDAVGRALTFDNVAIRLTATECLQIVLGRVYSDDDDFLKVFVPMLHSQTVEVLIRIYEFTRIDPEDIDDDAYTFLQKFAEMVATIESAIEPRVTLLPSECDLLGYLKLLFLIAGHDSPTVSGPAISAWTKIYRSPNYSGIEAVTNTMPELLDLATSRLLKFESLKDERPAIAFLDADFDTQPEKHAFLGNYRRYAGSLVESILKKKPFDAFPYILSRVDATLQAELSRQGTIDPNTYQKNSPGFLEVDAQFLAVEASIKGYMKRVETYAKMDKEEQVHAFEAQIEQWVLRLLGLQFQDPLILRRVIQVAVAIATSILEHKPEVMFQTLQHILVTRPKEGPPNSQYTEAVKDLQSVCYPEMQRMAMIMPDHLMEHYDSIKQTIDQLIASGPTDDRQIVAYHTFLFTINHRTTRLGEQEQLKRLQAYIQPIREAWTSPQLTQALSSFEGFCNLVSLDKARQYLLTHNAHMIPDFSAQPLDAEGIVLQQELQDKLKGLPIRPTKAFLGVSTDKLIPNTRAYSVACDLWRDAFVEILPNLLQFLAHAHAFHNPANWGALPPEFQPVIKKVLTDRFWQSGISSGSRDQFYETVNRTKTSLEGLASSTRGTVRMVRESCYSILWCMSRMDMLFYGIDQLPGPLSQALFENAPFLSSHQMSILLNMTRYIIDDCPPSRRDHFLTPFLAALFKQIDIKITNEWTNVAQKNQAAMGEEQLAEEMKEESILRQLTYIAVLMVSSSLESGEKGESDSMRDFLLSRDVILEPLIIFCIHALRMHDSRCCGIIIRVFRSIIPRFVKDREIIREIICRDVLMAAIESLHDDYFVDVQKDLAQLIATICIHYSPVSATPRNILCSLPGIPAERVDNCIKTLLQGVKTARVQRSLILSLLENLRGVALSEKGKVAQPRINAPPPARPKRQVEDRKSPDLGGVADMFS